MSVSVIPFIYYKFNFSDILVESNTIVQNEILPLPVVTERSLPSQEHCNAVIRSSTTNLTSTFVFLYGSDAQYGYIKSPSSSETCTIITYSDGPTFHHVNGQYFADKNYVYFMTVTNKTVIPNIVHGADTTTFQKLEIQHSDQYSEYNLLFRDSKHLYYNGLLVNSASPDTIKKLWFTRHFTDSNIFVSVGYYIDGNAVYYFGNGDDFGQVIDVDISSFHTLGDDYASDNYRVYKGKDVLIGVDPKAFIKPKSPVPPCTEC